MEKGKFPLMTGKEEIGDRRLAAIMFTDIVGYTALTEKDESLSLNLLKEYRVILRSSFGRFSGREIETIGDGTLAEFQSSLQAVQCAYEIQTTLSQLNKPRSESNRIIVRIGIHIGDVIHLGLAIFGDAVNVASRIQSVCEPGGISISEEIYHQVRNKVSFAFESVGEQKLKNVEQPIEIFKVVVISNSIYSNQEKNQLSTARFLSQELPFTDRILETQVIRNLVDKSGTTKQGSLVFISGEPGIGKTRLANEIKGYALAKNFTWLSTICNRSEDAVPYSPWIQLIREFSNRAPTALFYKICGTYINQIVRLIPELTESSGVAPFHPSSIRDPSQEADTEAVERRQFYQALTQFFIKLSRESSGLVLHFDDIQWADQATLQLLKFLLSSTLNKEPITIILSYREVETKSGENQAVARFLKDMDYERRGIRIELKRLEEPDVGKMLSSLSGQRDVSSEFTELIYSKTGGNPFFIEEVLKSLVEKQDIFANERGQWDRKPIKEIEVPESIRSLIQERVARLDMDTRDTLQTASVIGDSFDYEILREVIQENLDHDRLNTALERGVISGFICEGKEDVGSPLKFKSKFAFADESIRDVLQDQVDNQRKVSTHLKTALALEKIGRDNSSFRSEVSASIAYHYLSSGEKPKALEYFIIAGDRSASLFAHEEAAKHYSIAVELVSEGESKGKLLKSLGDETWLIGDSEEALYYWIKAAEIYEKIGDNGIASDLYRRIAFTYHSPFLDKNNSILYINKAITLLENSHQIGWELAAAYLNAALIYAWDSQIRKAKELFEKGLHFAQESDSRFIEGVAAYTSFFVVDIKEKDRVLNNCDDAIKYLVETSNIRQASFAQATRAGWFALVKGASQETWQVFQDAMNYAEKVGVNTALLFIKASLAINVDLALGRFDEARKIADWLRLIAESSPSLLTVKCYALEALGLLQLYLGDLGESKKNLSEITKIAKGFGNSSFAVQPYLALARIYTIEGNYSEAEKYILAASEVSEKREHLLSNAMFHMELLSLKIELALRSKNITLKATQDLLSEMKNLSEEIGEHWASAYCLRSEGLIALNQVDLEKATRLLSESEKMCARSGWLYEQAQTKFNIATGYHGLGNITNARRYNQEALEIFSSLGAKIDIDKCIALENELQKNIDLPKFLNQTSRITFDYLVGSFVEDNSVKNLNPQSSGWRTLAEIAKNTGVPVSSLYFRAVSGGSDSTLNNLLSNKIVEAKTFKGERGRGGEVTRYRISYDKEQVKDCADMLIQKRSEMLH